jgi:hypothetical protein
MDARNTTGDAAPRVVSQWDIGRRSKGLLDDNGSQ